MGQANANQSELDGFIDQIEDANADLDTVNGASGLVPSAASELVQVQLRVNETQDVIDDNNDKITELENAVNAQRIVTDFSTQNDSEIVLSTPSELLGQFCVDDGETLEFHLSASDQAGVALDVNGDPTSMLGTMNQVKAIVLKLVGGPTVAESRQDDNTVRGHQHSIFYKVTNNSGVN